METFYELEKKHYLLWTGLKCLTAVKQQNDDTRQHNTQNMCSIQYLHGTVCYNSQKLNMEASFQQTKHWDCQMFHINVSMKYRFLKKVL